MAIAISVALVAALLAQFLPSAAGTRYAQVMHPSALAVAGVLALWVSRYYRAAMRNAFLLIGGFFVSSSNDRFA
jgi:hypothetical protein